MKVHFKTIFSVILFITTCIAIAETPPEGPYFGLTPPGLTPEVFAPGRISLSNSIDYSICFSKDGGECYFTVANASWSDYRIYETHYEGGEWTTPAQASFSNNLSMIPCLADNDQSMYFTRSADAWKATRSGSGWSSPVQMGAPLSSPQDDWSCHISNLGNAFLCSFRPGGSGGCDLWKVQYENGNFTTAAPLNINTTFNDCQPVPGPNEEYIIFSASLPGGYGDFDLYISFADGIGGWTLPQNLGPTINTSGRDVYPYISPDHKYLFFSRRVSSTDFDIYWVDIRALFPVTDFSCDGKIDFEDLKILAAYWLADEPLIDIAPPEAPDGIINFREFAMLAQDWRRTDFTAPLAPTGLQITGGNSTISLDWNNNSEDNLAGYNIYRSTTFGSGYAKLNGSLLSSSDYVDNTVTNGTIYYYVVTAEDTYSSESAYSSQVSAIPLDAGNIIIQENSTGFCSVDGEIASAFANYTGYGYAQTMMYDTGYGINWGISVPSDGIYTFKWRHAHGAGNRTARLLVNGSEAVSNINFPGTGDGSIWSQVSVDVSLTAGTKDIRLEATTEMGLSLIDYLMVTGDSPAAASCP